MSRFARLATLVPLVTLLSCASTSELVRRGDSALEAGNAERAFDWARRALEREPGNPQAREIMTAAATSLMSERKVAVIHLAEVDTLAAARASLELDDFRAQLAGHRVTLAPDPEFRNAEAALRIGAAHIYYVKGVASLRAHFPKRAHDELTEASRFAPGYGDLAEQLDRAWQQAVTRLAILPFNNEVSEPRLAQLVSDEVFGQLQNQLGSAKRFRFTRLIGQEEVNRKLTVAQSGRLSREEAVQLGRQLGAQRVVFGRIHDLRADTHTDTYREKIFHKVSERGEDGKYTVDYKELPFEAVARWRNVSIEIDFEVIETDEGGRLAADSQARGIGAHTVFTRSTQPLAPSGDYCLVPPNEASTDYGKYVEKSWHSLFGSWTLDGMLDKSRRDASRTRYEERYRRDFQAAGTSTPVWLDDLPPVQELAYLALADSWMPMFEMLRELDGRDDVEIVTRRNGD